MSSDLKSAASLLGLNRPQSAVLHALHARSQTLPEIAATTRVPRTSLYYMLKTLETRGLIQKQKRNKTWIWSALPLSDVLSNYQNSLEHCIGAPIESQTTTVDKHTHVTVHHSTLGTLSSVEELSYMPPHSRLYGIQPKASLIQAITKNNIASMAVINQRIKQRHLIMEGAIHESGTEAIWKTLSKDDAALLLKSLGNRSADTVRLPENFLPDTKAEVYLYGNTVLLINWEKEFSVSIKDDDIFALIKSMFDSTKYLMERYDQNEKIARKLIDL